MPALFFIYALPENEPFGWRRLLLGWAAAVLTLATLCGLAAQSIMLAGSVELGLSRESLGALVGITSLGKAFVVRAIVAAIAAALLRWAKPGRRLWLVVAILGAVAAASFAWMGHAAGGEGDAGMWHLIADLIHALTAAGWIGALIGFAFVAGSQPSRQTLAGALRRFSAIGLPMVALLAATGLINAWFLIGVDHLAQVPRSPYGQLLLAKLALFAAMIGLAAANRFHFAKVTAEHGSLAGVRRSLTIEAALGIAVLGVVAWLGMMEPLGQG